MCRVHFTFAFAPLIELSRFVPRMIFAQFRGTLQRASRKCNFIDSPFSLADLPTQLTFRPSSRYVALVSNHGPTSACAHNSFDEGEQARNLPKNIQILAQFSRSSPHYYFRDKSLCSERALMMGAHGIGAWKEARSAIFDGAKRVPSNTNRRFDGWWLLCWAPSSSFPIFRCVLFGAFAYDVMDLGNYRDDWNVFSTAVLSDWHNRVPF